MATPFTYGYQMPAPAPDYPLVGTFQVGDVIIFRDGASLRGKIAELNRSGNQVSFSVRVKYGRTLFGTDVWRTYYFSGRADSPDYYMTRVEK